MRRGWIILACCGTLVACGKTRGSEADGGSGGTVGGSTQSGGSGHSGGLVSGSDTAGVTVGSGGTSAGGTSMGTGGSAGQRAVGRRLNEAAGCLEGETVTFTILDPGCGAAPSLQRDAQGQCWWIDGMCDIEGLEYDDCGYTMDDTPPDCGEGGAGGEGGGTGTIACEDLGCMPSASSAFCGDVEGDTWICTGSFNHQALIDAGCVDLFTQVPRYCCPDGVCR